MNVRTPALWLPLFAASATLLANDDLWTPERLEAASREISGQIEALRNQPFKHGVSVALQDKEGLVAYMKKRQDEFEPEAKRVATEELAKLFGLMPADLDLQALLQNVIEEQVGGFYDPAEDKFFLMEAFGGDIGKVIMAHELTHALDDQYYDLDGTLEGLLDSTDAVEAYRAVIEGSAMYAMQAWMFKHAAELDTKALMESQDLTTGGLEDAPAFVWKPLLGAYMQGLAFMAKGDKSDDDFIRRAFEDPPSSTEQVLHPEKYWDPAKRDEPVEVRFALESLPGDWEVLHQDTIGELYLGLMTAPAKDRGGLDVSNPMAMLAIKYTNDAAAGWDGDRVVLLGKGDARVARMVSVWDSEADAEEFETALNAAFATLDDDARRYVKRAGDVVDVVVSSKLEELPNVELKYEIAR